MAVDFTALGATYRVEARKALHRALAIGVVLVLAHLLDIRPSEFDGLGLKFKFQDPAILYGGIAMLYGYYLSRFASLGDVGESLHRLNIAPRKMRLSILTARRVEKAERDKMRKKGKTQTPKTPTDIKKSARNLYIFSNVILAPYYIVSVSFMSGALIFAVYDLGVLLGIILFRVDAYVTPLLNSL